MGALGRRLPLGPGPSGRGRGLTGFLRGPGPPEQPHRPEASAPLPSWVLWSRSPWASEAIPTDVLTWPREKPPQHPLSPCPKPQRTNRVASRSGARTRPEPSVRPDAGTTCLSILPSPLQPYLKSRKAQYRKTRLLSLAASPYCLPVCNETRQLREAAGGAGLGTVRTLAGPQAFAVPRPPWRMLVPQDPLAPSGLCALGPSEAGPAPRCPEPAHPRLPPAALSRGPWPHHHHAGARGVLAG